MIAKQMHAHVDTPKIHKSPTAVKMKPVGRLCSYFYCGVKLGCQSPKGAGPDELVHPPQPIIFSDSCRVVCVVKGGR